MALGSCGIIASEDFVDFDEFTVLPSFADLDFSNVSLKEGIVYWELREAFYFDYYQVRASGGVIGRDSLDPPVLAALDTIVSYSGFALTCLPDLCFSYFATVDERDEVEVWEFPQRVRELLTPIESVAEVALQALAKGYYWSGHLETSAYRTVSYGFELVMLDLGINGCAPVQVLLGLTTAGDIGILKQRYFSRFC